MSDELAQLEAKTNSKCMNAEVQILSTNMYLSNKSQLVYIISAGEKGLSCQYFTKYAAY